LRTGRLQNFLVSASGCLSFFSSSLSAFLQRLTWTGEMAMAGGTASGSSGSNLATGTGTAGGDHWRPAPRLPPPPPPGRRRDGEFPVAAVVRWRLDAWMEGGEGEADGGGGAGGVVGVAVARAGGGV
jgi:hypothetical protein